MTRMLFKNIRLETCIIFSMKFTTIFIDCTRAKNISNDRYKYYKMKICNLYLGDYLFIYFSNIWSKRKREFNYTCCAYSSLDPDSTINFHRLTPQFWLRLSNLSEGSREAWNEKVSFSTVICLQIF